MTQYWEEQRERSTLSMVYLMGTAALLFGRRIARVILLPIVGYFLLTSPRAARASRQALRRLLGRQPTWRDVARHFYSFAMCAVDRIYLLADRLQKFRVVTHRPPEVAQIAANGGCLLLVAHLGSFEAMRMMGTTQRKLPLAILMDRKQGRMLVGLLERVNRGAALQLIDAALRGPELVLKLKENLQAGRIVCMMADRARADERALEVEFAGDSVRVPEGPWAIAAALGVPVILGFGLFRGGNRYETYFELFSERVVAARANRAAALRAHAQAYARRLEHYARLEPYNWFNFYDYWGDAPVGASAPATGP